MMPSVRLESSFMPPLQCGRCYIHEEKRVSMIVHLTVGPFLKFVGNVEQRFQP